MAQTNRPRKRDDSSYISALNGGAAPRREYAEPYEKPRPEPAHKNDRRIKKQKKQQKKAARPVFEIVRKTKRGTSAWTYALAGVIFAGAILCVVAFAAKAREEVVLAGLESEYKTLHDDNVNAENENYYGYSLEEIDKRCRELGMKEPDDSQIVYVTVPKEGYAVQYDSGADTQPAGKINFFSEILNLFKNDKGN